ncbi:hypothetical protein TWF506_009723 [Arthrobotrys conoides]|uniref:Uncharacterized protein n=1 Tax=Arthrobotrys conoides TaxID=74498 RepID=A0AAN8N2Q3_9PEZI
MDLTSLIADELEERQKSLQGAWIFGPDDLQSSGSIEESLFAFLNTKTHLRDLHLGGISTVDHVVSILNNFDRIPNELRRLTVHVPDPNILDELLGSDKWQKYQQTYKPQFDQPLRPKLPWLTQLSVQGVDDDFFEGIRSIDHIFPLQQLEELKFTSSGQISSILNHMTGKCTRLKVLHLWGATNETALSEYLVSLQKLTELVLDIQDSELQNLDTLKLDCHSQYLTKLYLRFQNGGDQPSGSWFLRLLQRGCSFPNLTEVAFSMPSEDFASLREQDVHLPRLKLLWLVQDKRTWDERKLKLDNITPVLRPLFRDDKSRPRWQFLAVGDYPHEDNWPIIYEFCESVTVNEKICTGMDYVTHRRVFEHNPDLTLLNCFEIWLPWEEE